MTRYAPKDVTDGIKLAVAAPDSRLSNSECQDYVDNTLRCSDAKIYNHPVTTIVGCLIGEHLNRSHKRRLLNWALVDLDRCCERFL